MSKIEWTDVTWNPVTGCDKVSQGCKNCYAEKMHRRLMHIAPHKYKKTFLGNIEFHYNELLKPFKWKKGKRIFVNSMSDLFHKDVPFYFIDAVFKTIDENKQHTFQIVTKRPERALEYFTDRKLTAYANVWIGTSVEDQKTANERIPHLTKIPAVVKFLSCEPMLGPIDLNNLWLPSINGWYEKYWVIAGGESGHNARPMHPDWIRDIRDFCKRSKVPFFFKQWGEWIDNQNFPREHITSKKLKQHIFGKGYFTTEVWKLGKSKTGNLLDGLQHLNFPK